MDVKIDKEFAALCPPLTPEERNLLEASIEKDGCQEPLDVWDHNGQPLLDGHNRLEICRSLRVPFKTRPVKLSSRGEAINWVIARQLGRRNATEQQKSYLRGKRYQAEKKQGARTDKTSGQNDQKSTTAEKLAAEYGVSEKTIRRDADFASTVDEIEKKEGPKSKAAVLSGEVKLKRKKKKPKRTHKEPSDLQKDARVCVADIDTLLKTIEAVTERSADRNEARKKLRLARSLIMQAIRLLQ